MILGVFVFFFILIFYESLSHDHCIVLVHFPDVLITLVTTAIPTSHNVFILQIVSVLWLLCNMGEGGEGGGGGGRVSHNLDLYPK